MAVATKLGKLTKSYAVSRGPLLASIPLSVASLSSSQQLAKSKSLSNCNNRNLSTTTKTSDDVVAVREKYRSLARLVNRLPESKSEQSWEELRAAFRAPMSPQETLDQRLKNADERITFLKMVTPKPASQELGKGGRWIYKDGKRVEGASATKRDANGKVISNWDGKNLDPDSVKRHNHHLKRLGYRNNAHAKGIF